MLIKFSELPIPFGAVLIDTEGNRYFKVVTEAWLREVFSQAVSMNVANYLGVDNWQGWWDMDEALEELYPDYVSCWGVAEAMIYDWMNNAS